MPHFAVYSASGLKAHPKGSSKLKMVNSLKCPCVSVARLFRGTAWLVHIRERFAQSMFVLGKKARTPHVEAAPQFAAGLVDRPGAHLLLCRVLARGSAVMVLGRQMSVRIGAICGPRVYAKAHPP